MVEDKLKIDLINDRVYRVGNIVRGQNGVLLDNILNLCANKISDILGREEPKDIFDLYTVYKHDPQDWKRVIAEAGKKCFIDLELLKFRFDSFPVEMVEYLPLINRDVRHSFKHEYSCLVSEIIG